MTRLLPRLLFLLLLPFASTHAQAAPVESATYNGLTAFRLSDGKTEAVIVPSLSGRVMRFGAVGGANWLWNAPPEKLAGDGYKNWGGDKTFVGPHSSWKAFADNIWPPDPTWDGATHRAETLPNGHLQTTGNVWRGFGVRVVRDFSFAENGDFVVSQRLEKTAGEPRVLAIWQVAQIAPPDAVFLPLNPRSAYAHGFHPFGTLPTDANVQVVSPNLLKIAPTTGSGYKLGADSPVAAIAAVRNGVALVLRAARPDGDYADGAEGAGFPVEFYNHGEGGAGQYVELELLSPLRRFVRGGAWTHTVRWSLHLLSSRDNSSEYQQEIARLLHE